MPYVAFQPGGDLAGLAIRAEAGAAASSRICCGVLPVCFSTASRYAWKDIVVSLSV
jgi:hypothetical protein